MLFIGFKLYEIKIWIIKFKSYKGIVLVYELFIFYFVVREYIFI